jgi:hypothetical protein
MRLVSRTRCSVLHAAPQSRDPDFCCNGPRIRSAPRREDAARCAASGARKAPSLRDADIGVRDDLGPTIDIGGDKVPEIGLGSLR